MKDIITETKAILREIKKETGQAFILVLMLLALGGLVLAPLLTYVNTGLQAEQEYNSRTKDLYAADAGIEDGLWQIRYDNLNSKFTFPSYDAYDYDIFGTSYAYPDMLDVNGRPVEVSITNVWIPRVDPSPLTLGMTKTDMRDIIESGHIIVIGKVVSPGIYEIKIKYEPMAGEQLKVSDIGIWLPPGFTYLEGSSNLEDDELAYYYPSDVFVESYASGQSIIWHYEHPGIEFTALPDVITTSSIWEVAITFEYDGPLNREPEAISWMETSPASIGDDLPPFAWDADVKVFRIESVAGDVEVEAYAVKSELRQLQGAISGDYYATGNAFLYPSSSYYYKYRDRMYSTRSAAVSTADEQINGIPEDGAIFAAYLYWTGWIDNDGYDPGATGGDIVWQDDCSEYGTWTSFWTDDCSSLGTWTSIWLDDCSSMGAWNSVWTDDCSSMGTWVNVWTENCSSYNDAPYTWSDGGNWSEYYGEFRARGGGTTGDRTLSLGQSINLSAYSGDKVIISWNQRASNAVDSTDYMAFYISNNGGGSWYEVTRFYDDDPPGSYSYTIPSEYLTSGFRVRFIWNANSTNEYYYIDDISLDAQTSTTWDAGSHWDESGSNFNCYGGGTQTEQTITYTQDIDLSGCTGMQTRISVDASFSGAEDTDVLYCQFYDGSSWSSSQEVCHGTYSAGTYSVLIDEAYLTENFRIRFFWNANSSTDYIYLDNMEISYSVGGWSSGNHWSEYYGEFRCLGGGTTAERTLTLNEDIDLSSYAGQSVALTWDQRETGYLFYDDSLYYYLSNDGGATWGESGLAFNDDDPLPSFSCTIPQDYLTSQFRIRFVWTGNNSYGDEYCYIDDIELAYNVGGWSSGSHWTEYFGEFRCLGGGTTAERTLSMNEDIDLSAYLGQTVNIAWDQSETGYLSSSDALYYYFSNDGGATWGISGIAFSDDNPGAFNYVIPQDYLTSQFRIRLVWTGDNSYGDEYCYVDDIELSSLAGSWAPNSHWSEYYGEFRCYGSGTNAERTLSLNENIDLSIYTGETVVISWDQRETGYLSSTDTLYFYFSNDGGATWGISGIAFSDDNPAGVFSYTIPEEYLTSQFRVRFIWDADGVDEYCYLDDISITLPGDYNGLEYPAGATQEQIAALVENNARVNKVLFGADAGDLQEIYAENYQVLEPYIWNGYSDEGQGTWSYCCYADVTDTVNQWIEDGDLSSNGTGTYTMKNAWVNVPNEVDPSYSWSFADGGSTGYPLGTPADSFSNLKDQNCHSGWSLILVYSSAQTAGRQLYLYDINNPGFNYTQARRTDPDFDGDGQPGGIVKGFLVPEQIVGETEAGRTTVFVGEGDNFITGDSMLINGAYMSNADNPTNNVWNSESTGLDLTESGIDIDTFSISWASHLIEEGDTQATVNMPTEDDGIHIIYLIFSFRSDIFTGGTITYLIN